MPSKKNPPIYLYIIAIIIGLAIPVIIVYSENLIFNNILFVSVFISVFFVITAIASFLLIKKDAQRSFVKLVLISATGALLASVIVSLFSGYFGTYSCYRGGPGGAPINVSYVFQDDAIALVILAVGLYVSNLKIKANFDYATLFLISWALIIIAAGFIFGGTCL